MLMIVKVRKIGNSVGVILSKAVLDQCSIKDEVNVEVLGDSIIIQPVSFRPREGWAAQYKAAGSLDDKEILMDEVGNSFDDSEWTW